MALLLQSTLILFGTLLVSAWVKDMENPNLYQGDMILSPEQMIQAKKGKFSFGSIRNRLWPKLIPYDYDYEIARSKMAVAAIQHAIMDYEKYTCLRFKRRTTEQNYMYFYKGGGCASYVGMFSGKNIISLGGGCWNRGTALHEIGHSLGFHHEQSRPDRDTYLKVHYENIPKHIRYNFNKEAEVDSRGTPYDYRSIMHYAKTAFGIDGKVTLEPLDPYYIDLIGTGQGFSSMDIKQINLVYGCPPYKGPMPPEPTPECHDGSKYCEMYAVAGRCKQDRFKKWCPFTCRQCKLVSGTHPPIQTRPPVTTAPSKTTTKPPPTVPDGPNCKDLVNNCLEYKKNCHDPRHIHMMRKYCGVTCGFCSFSKTTAIPKPTTKATTTKPPCSDKAIGCERYKDKCNADGNWKTTMPKMCKKTCNFC